MCIEHQQSTTCVCKVQLWDVILPDNQVVHAANHKKWQYSPAKVTNHVDINFHQSCKHPKCQKMNTTFVTKVITRNNPCVKGGPWWGRKAAATSISLYNWCLKVQRTSGTKLVLPLICVAIVMHKQMPYVTPQCTDQCCQAIECIQTLKFPLDNHNDRDCHHHCDASTHTQD